MAGAPTRTRTAVRYSPAPRVGPCAGLRAQSQSWLTDGSRSSRSRRRSTSRPAAARSAERLSAATPSATAQSRDCKRPSGARSGSSAPAGRMRPSPASSMPSARPLCWRSLLAAQSSTAAWASVAAARGSLALNACRAEAVCASKRASNGIPSNPAEARASCRPAT
eukprot:2000338-Pyramimonas_sp.AAC.1